MRGRWPRLRDGRGAAPRERTHDPVLSVEVLDGIAIITIDLPGESVNKFSAAVIAEFDALMTQIDDRADVKAAVLISGKPDAFIAGADIDAFLDFKTAQDAEAAERVRPPHRWRGSRVRARRSSRRFMEPASAPDSRHRSPARTASRAITPRPCSDFPKRSSA